MPESAAARAKRQATARAYAKRKRAEARALKQQEKVPMDVVRPPDELPPWTPDAQSPADVVLADPGPVRAQPPATPRDFAPATVPQTSPLATWDEEIPAHTPFSYTMNAPLSPSDVDTITTFYNLYMGNPPVALQGMTTPSARAQVKRQMLQDAAVVLPLLQRQYELARLGDSANGQEALQVKRNLEWVEQRLSEVQG